MTKLSLTVTSKAQARPKNQNTVTHHTDFNIDLILLHKLFFDLKYKVPNTSFHSMKLIKFPINFNEPLLLTRRRKDRVLICSCMHHPSKNFRQIQSFPSFHLKEEQVQQCKYPSLKGEDRQNLGHWTDAWTF